MNNDNVDEAISWVGEYRARHQMCVYEILGTTYSWTELGSDQRLTEWLYGHWQRGFGGDDFLEYVKKTLKDGERDILQYIKSNYDVGESDDVVYTYIADKVMKSIAYGGTWMQMLRYIEKEVQYYRKNVYRKKSMHDEGDE